MVAIPTGQQLINAISEAVPKIRGVPIVANVERILQRGTDFVRGNPIVSTASIGAGVTGLVAAAVVIAKKRKAPKRRAPKRRAPKRKKLRRKTHRSPRHRGHKLVTFKAKGKKVRFLVRGQKRSRKHHRKRKGKRFVKGSPEAKRFMAKLRRMKRR